MAVRVAALRGKKHAARPGRVPAKIDADQTPGVFYHLLPGFGGIITRAWSCRRRGRLTVTTCKRSQEGP